MGAINTSRSNIKTTASVTGGKPVAVVDVEVVVVIEENGQATAQLVANIQIRDKTFKHEIHVSGGGIEVR